VLDLILPALTAFVGSTAGVLVGWRIQRGREKREIRLPVYVEWLKAARTLVGPPGPHPGLATIELPDPQAKMRLNEVTTEMELVASPDVARAADEFLRRLYDASTQAEMARPLQSMDEAVDRFQEWMKETRQWVVQAMRRDLGTS
jgi:hypothetical protein